MDEPTAPPVGAGLRFDDAEMTRRADALDLAARESDVRHVVLYGANRAGSAVQWLTGWPVTREAVAVHTPGERDALFVGFYNHVPQARAVATGCDVRHVGPRTDRTLVEELHRRGARPGDVAVVGPLPVALHRGLAEAFGPVLDLAGAYTRLRLTKSPPELAVLREAARLTDLTCESLQRGARVGSTDHELGALVEQADRPLGGGTYIHYFAMTSMSAPQQAVPQQWPTGRVLREGDVLSCELSSSVRTDYPGQLLRTFTVAAPATPLVRELHDVADAALSAIEAVLRPGATAEHVVAAAEVIEDAGFTTVDDLVHGLGGGYLPPVLGSRSRTLEPLPTLPFAEGMTVVVQPNVTVPDGTLGVQTGELVEITADGCRRMHAHPRGLGRVAG